MLASVYTFVYTECMAWIQRKPMVQRVIRVPEPLWEAAKERAGERGETVSEAVRKFLERYVR